MKSHKFYLLKSIIAVVLFSNCLLAQDYQKRRYDFLGRDLLEYLDVRERPNVIDRSRPFYLDDIRQQLDGMSSDDIRSLLVKWFSHDGMSLADAKNCVDKIMHLEAVDWKSKLSNSRIPNYPSQSSMHASSVECITNFSVTGVRFNVGQVLQVGWQDPEGYFTIINGFKLLIPEGCVRPIR